MPRFRLRDDEDSLWLSVADSHENGFSMLVSDRPHRLLAQIPHPDHQKPRLFVFLGSKTRHAAMRTMWPSALPSRQRRKLTGCHLALEAASAFSDRPLILAEADISQNVQDEVEINHSTDRVIVHYDIGSSRQKPCSSDYGLVYARVMCPFAEVVCVFVQDYPNLEYLVNEIAGWIHQGRAVTFSDDSVRPQLLLVTKMNLSLSLEEFTTRLVEVSGKPFRSTFSQISIVPIRDETVLSALARYRPVKDAVMRSADEVRFARDRCLYLFSARHFISFLDMAAHDLSLSPLESFDIVQASRRSSPVAAGLQFNISDFLTTIILSKVNFAKAIPIVSTALLADHYGPRMHSFHPHEVFMALYSKVCMEAILKTQLKSSVFLPLSEWMNLLEQSFVSSFQEWQVQPEKTTTMDIHLRNIAGFSDRMAYVAASSYCLLCFMRPPATPRMSCGHRICRVCLKKVGVATPRAPRTFSLGKCPLCQRAVTPISLYCTPPTASPRVLSLDGGGNRVIVALEVLQLLAESVPVPGFVNRIADVVAGTSSGGLASLLLFLQGLSVKQCQEILSIQAGHAFTPRDTLPIPFLSHIQALIVSGCADSLYPSEGIECALKQTYGTERRLVDESWASRHGIKLLLPATAVPGNVPYLFSNGPTTTTFVKGAKDHDVSRPGVNRIAEYQAVSDLLGSDDIRLWQVARAISAAPPFFTPYFIQCLGENIQDGALCENCPVRTATREANRNNESLLPAYVLSLGTGSAPRAPSSQRLWGRLADYLDRSLDSSSVWSNFVLDHPHLQRLGRLHRFDLDTKNQIRLDNVDEIPNMMQQVRAKYQNSPKIAEFRLLALVNMFYFELTKDMRAKPDGVLDARILCHWQSDEEGFHEWQNFVYDLNPRVFVNGQLCGTISADIFGNLQCLVRIPFDDQTSIIRCQIQLGTDAPVEIGDSPFEISNLRRLQGFNSPFATLEA